MFPAPWREMILFGKQLIHIFKGLELQGIARRILDEENLLLARFAFEAGAWLDEKIDLVFPHAADEFLPLIHPEHHPEMEGRNLVAIDFVALHDGRIVDEMSDDLVTEEVEVDPLVAAPADSTPDDVTVERLGPGEVVDGKGEVERTHHANHGQAFHLMLQPMLGS